MMREFAAWRCSIHFTTSQSRHFRATTLSRAFQQRSCPRTQCRHVSPTTSYDQRSTRRDTAPQLRVQVSPEVVVKEILASWKCMKMPCSSVLSHVRSFNSLSVIDTHCVSLHAWGKLTKARTCEESGRSKEENEPRRTWIIMNPMNQWNNPHVFVGWIWINHGYIIKFRHPSHRHLRGDPHALLQGFDVQIRVPAWPSNVAGKSSQQIWRSWSWWENPL